VEVKNRVVKLSLVVIVLVVAIVWVGYSSRRARSGGRTFERTTARLGGWRDEQLARAIRQGIGNDEGDDPKPSPSHNQIELSLRFRLTSRADLGEWCWDLDTVPDCIRDIGLCR